MTATLLFSHGILPTSSFHCHPSSLIFLDEYSPCHHPSAIYFHLSTVALFPMIMSEGATLAPVYDSPGSVLVALPTTAVLLYVTFLHLSFFQIHNNQTQNV